VIIQLSEDPAAIAALLVKRTTQATLASGATDGMNILRKTVAEMMAKGVRMNRLGHLAHAIAVSKLLEPLACCLASRRHLDL
jgi:hypothetical protein